MATNASPTDRGARFLALVSAITAVVAVFLAWSDGETSREAVRHARVAVEQAQTANRIANEANDVADGANELASKALEQADLANELAREANDLVGDGNDIADFLADREKQEYARDFQVVDLGSSLQIRGGPDSGGVTNVQLVVLHWKADGAEPVLDFNNPDQIDVWTAPVFASCQSSTVPVTAPLASNLYVLRFTDKAGVQWSRSPWELSECPTTPSAQEELEAFFADNPGSDRALALQELDVPGCTD
ncbi:hypothetical protein [Cryobacterium sp. TMS1-13-1]|uniref:hypothetical protein n=1 Tax=Cryobacterium sp. TMS1-13-1 TaxID=1259220 RepID=UPI00106AB53C|nr:hypothetical protein [Cryobacterium sp. TMS1-13-1]TFD21358.1 hypothetical protein E3T31_11070 [Cryobacterium sp. TMS1-13-1]